MISNQRFAVSLHILTLLASQEGPLTSEAIAQSVNTNPVVIRRTLANLRARRLVESRPGANGGWRLLNTPDKVRLSEVYRMLGQNGVLSMHSHPNLGCRVGAHIRKALDEVFTTAQRGMEEALGEYTVADVLSKVRVAESELASQET